MLSSHAVKYYNLIFSFPPPKVQPKPDMMDAPGGSLAEYHDSDSIDPNTGLTHGQISSYVEQNIPQTSVHAPASHGALLPPTSLSGLQVQAAIQQEQAGSLLRHGDSTLLRQGESPLLRQGESPLIRQGAQSENPLQVSQANLFTYNPNIHGAPFDLSASQAIQNLPYLYQGSGNSIPHM